MKWVSFNKYTALIIILIFLLVCYYITTKKKNIFKKSNKTKNIKNKSNSKSKSKKKSKKTRISNKIETEEDDEIDEETDEIDEDDNVNKDAEELYNLAHDGLCNGIKSEEFEELVGDLASTSVFIDLKQIYNQCTQKGLNPNSTIKIEDYVRVLKNENV